MTAPHRTLATLVALAAIACDITDVAAPTQDNSSAELDLTPQRLVDQLNALGPVRLRGRFLRLVLPPNEVHNLLVAQYGQPVPWYEDREEGSPDPEVGSPDREVGSPDREVGRPDQECAQLVEHGRIGSLDGAPEYAFTEINSIAVGESGTVYVNDAHESSIREFGADGEFVRWIGRDGEGPGEFRSIAGVSILPDGRLAAWDRGNRRITVFAADGEYADAIRSEGVNPPYPFMDRAFRTDSAGRYYLRIFANPPSIAPDQSDMATVRYGYLRLSPDGTVLDTIVAPKAMPRGLAEPIVIYTRAGDRSPFPEEVLDALSPFGHLVVGHNGTYAFSILDPSGTIEVEREGFQPVEVKTEERAQWRARVAFAERRSGMSFRDVPTRKPAYRDLWVDLDGRIWIHRYAEAVDSGEPIPELWLDYLEGDEPRITWAEPSLYDVYSADGQPLYCVQAPADAEVVTSRGSLVWGILRGALDEEYVVSWRIE